jgi:hypothetical protein
MYQDYFLIFTGVAMATDIPSQTTLVSIKLTKIS